MDETKQPAAPAAPRGKGGQFAAKKQQNTETLARAKAITPNAVFDSVAKLRTQLGSTVANIGEQLQEKAVELETVTRAVDLQRAEAERIHGVEAISRTIDEANIVLETTKADLVRKTEEANRDCNAKLDAARAENTQKIQQLESDRKRTQADWQYTFENSKKAANDQLQEELRVARQAEKIRGEDQQRGWDLREKELQTREKELTDLRAKAATFDAEVTRVANERIGAATGAMKKDHTHELAIKNSEFSAKETVFHNTIAGLKETIVNKDKAIEQLTVQLAAAQTNLKEISTKALESSADRQRLADQQMIIQSQNGANQPKRA